MHMMKRKTRREEFENVLQDSKYGQYLLNKEETDI